MAQTSYLNLDNFIRQLTQLGLFGSLSEDEGYGEQGQGIYDYYDLSQLTSGNIRDAFASQVPGNVADLLSPGMFTTLSPDLLKSATMKKYSGALQSTQKDLLSSLASRAYSPMTKKVHGGFAGTGAVDVYGKSLSGEYSKGMGQALTGVYESKARATSALQDWLESQRDVVESFSS